MSLLEALVLGLVQGLTEFLPISSSGHIVLVPELLGWDRPPVSFVIFLHGATLIAVLAYFRRDLFQLATGIRRRRPERRLVVLLILGTIPAALIGFFFEERVSRIFDQPPTIALLLLGTGAILSLSEIIARRRELEPSTGSSVDTLARSISSFGALSIGIGQAVAILPGFSRSGWTIGTGLMLGLNRAQSARFSFLLSIPILAGAALVQIPDLAESSVGAGALVVGGLASLVSSYLAVAGMIGYLQRRGLFPFAIYCFLAGPIYSLLLR